MPPVLIPPAPVDFDCEDDDPEFLRERLQAYIRGLMREGIDCPNLIGRFLNGAKKILP